MSIYTNVCVGIMGIETLSFHLLLEENIEREREAERDREMGGGQPVADNDPPGGQQNLSPLSCAAKTASTHFTLCFNY